MLKPYKAESPIITINKIRLLLSEIGIFVSETYQQNGDFFACRIEIANENLIEYHIGTNGKGINLEFAYASAYAEFMERLQNQYLIREPYFFSKYYDNDCMFKERLKLENKELDFIFCPDEKLIETDKIIEDNYQLLNVLLSINSKNELKDFLINTLGFKRAFCVPFYNKKNSSINYLPIDILLYATNSTGMCAGNTPEEALIQGICEILERYAITEVYRKKLTPPSIPHEYFNKFSIFDSIKKLEEKGLEITIKDFSLGKKLPVIGVIAVDKHSRKYNVKVGSDPWPVIALERCLTELHQSFSGVKLIDKHDYGNYIEEAHSVYNRCEAEYINLNKILINATGQWPDSIFSDNASYNFINLNFDLAKNNTTDLKYLVQLIEEMGSEIYIRDVSYLGFNSYYVVAPGLSQNKSNKSEYLLYHKLNSLIRIINNTSILSNEELANIVLILEENYFAIKENYINFESVFFANTDPDASDLTLDLFLNMAFYKLGNIDKAYFYLNNYLKDKEVKDYLYFYACKDYLALLKEKIKNNDIKSYMTKIYGLDLAKEVIEDMLDASTVFKSYNLQSFFYSKDCNIYEFNYFNIASILNKIEKKHKAQPIDQLNLSKIFN